MEIEEQKSRLEIYIKLFGAHLITHSIQKREEEEQQQQKLKKEREKGV
jgi:hypothetical protein